MNLKKDLLNKNLINEFNYNINMNFNINFNFKKKMFFNFLRIISWSCQMSFETLI